MNRAVRLIIIVVVAGGLGIWRASSRWSKDSDEARSVILEIVQSLDCYQDNKAVLDQCADRAHKTAFAGAYKPAARFRRSDIDSDRYLDSVFHSLSDQFDMLNRQDLKKCLNEARARWKEESDNDATK